MLRDHQQTKINRAKRAELYKFRGVSVNNEESGYFDFGTGPRRSNEY
jgi:hypothetical protein